ncbi:MAG: hypothetical protein Q4D03_06295 [Bacteroidales bacterium]|nr:hypothetical protein [Bacteroidales bacterium]
MQAIKFDEKSLSRYPVAFYFSAVKAFEERIRAAECALDRFREMRDRFTRLQEGFVMVRGEIARERQLFAAPTGNKIRRTAFVSVINF